jgi:methylated-DNA-[protein]-cysteine S-methyltransferase
MTATTDRSVRIVTAGEGPRVFDLYDSPIGQLLLVAQSGALVELGLDEKAWSGGIDGLPRDPDALTAVRSELDEYFAGVRQTFTIAVALRGTPFQLQVWESLTAIPYGETASYGAVAAAVGRPAAARAIGAANHVNPVPIVVPCHRVIGADGSLTGYGGGLDRKTFLLELERG